MSLWRGSRVFVADKAMYRRQIIVTVAYVTAALVGALVCRYAEYHAGTINDLSAVLTSAFLFVPLLGLSGFIVGIYALSMFTRRPHTPGHIALRFVLLVVPLGAIVGAFFIVTPGDDMFLRGFGRWASSNVDIEAVQEWLATEGPAFVENAPDRRHVLGDPNAYPECLTVFEPAHIGFSQLATGELTVTFDWGGMFETWGLVVGPPTMETPQTGRIDFGSSTEFQRPVQPGAYVFSRG